MAHHVLGENAKRSKLDSGNSVSKLWNFFFSKYMNNVIVAADDTVINIACDKRVIERMCSMNRSQVDHISTGSTHDIIMQVQRMTNTVRKVGAGLERRTADISRDMLANNSIHMPNLSKTLIIDETNGNNHTETRHSSSHDPKSHETRTRILRWVDDQRVNLNMLDEAIKTYELAISISATINACYSVYLIYNHSINESKLSGMFKRMGNADVSPNADVMQTDSYNESICNEAYHELKQHSVHLIALVVNDFAAVWHILNGVLMQLTSICHVAYGHAKSSDNGREQNMNKTSKEAVIEVFMNHYVEGKVRQLNKLHSALMNNQFGSHRTDQLRLSHGMATRIVHTILGHGYKGEYHGNTSQHIINELVGSDENNIVGETVLEMFNEFYEEAQLQDIFGHTQYIVETTMTIMLRIEDMIKANESDLIIHDVVPLVKDLISWVHKKEINLKSLNKR